MGMSTPTDVARVPDMSRGVMTAASLDSRIRYAQTLAASNLLPAAYRQQPANVLLAVETGTMLGVHPIAALNGINVIQGKPTVSPALMTALVRRAGHKVRVRVTGTAKDGDLAATVEVIRADDPDFTYSATWTLDRAERAGLLRNDTWTKYPEAMLKARATSEVCREAAEEALCGVQYTPEELGAAVDEDGTVIDGQIIDVPDYRAQAAATADPDELRAIWMAAVNAGHMDDDLATALKTRAAEVEAADQTEDDEDVVDAEVEPTDNPAVQEALASWDIKESPNDPS